MTNMIYRARRWVSAWALGASLLFAGFAQAAPLYSQAPNPAGALYLSTNGVQNAESFTLGFAASITSLGWYGTAAPVGDFTVRLYSDSLATSADTYTLAAGTLVRSAAPVLAVAGFSVYEYTLTLASAFAAAADHEYFVAVFATSDWGWLDSTQGNGLSAFRGGDGSAWSTSAPDLSLNVNGDRLGAAVPEPASLALAGIALASAAGVARRRRR